jgi:hypothetical protein
MTFLTKPAELGNIAVAKKTSSAAVSSWGFSGYIAVLPKEDKPTVVTKPQEKQGESSQKTTENKCR